MAIQAQMTDFRIMKDIAIVCDPVTTTKPEKIANAKLIASAPDLLAELETMVNFCQGLRDSREMYPANLEAAQAIITKLKGQ